MNPQSPPAIAAKIPVIDPKATHPTREFKHEVPLTTLRADPAGRFVAAGAEDLDVQIWNLADGKRQTPSKATKAGFARSISRRTAGGC